MFTNRPPLDGGGLGAGLTDQRGASVEHRGEKGKTSGFQDFNYAGGSDKAGGRSVQLLLPSILIGQEVQLSSCCPIRILHPTSINVLIGSD